MARNRAWHSAPAAIRPSATPPKSALICRKSRSLNPLGPGKNRRDMKRDMRRDLKCGMKRDLKRDTRRGVDDGYINAGQDGGNNPKKPLTERWRHAGCHSSRKRFSGLNATWHQGGTTLVPPRARWCHQKRCADNRMAPRWHHPFYLAHQPLLLPQTRPPAISFPRRPPPAQP